MYKQNNEPAFYIITGYIDFRCGIDSLCLLLKKITKIDSLSNKILEIHVHQYKKILANGTSEKVKIDNPYANPLGKTMVSTSLVSSIIVNKVINALPLYRQ